MTGRTRLLRRRQEEAGGDDPSARPLPTVAVLTIARDEAAMLPRWVSHYGAQVGTENLIVLDDNSTDGSTTGLPCTVHRIPGFGETDFEAKRVRLVSGIARGLLQVYDVVVFVDTDEFIIPDPDRYEGLRDFLRRRTDDVIAPLGFNVVHHVGVEPPLRPDEPVLGQRRLVKFAPVMCKPAIKRIDAAWAAASHGIRAPYAVDPGVFMMHLKFADRDLLQDVADRRHALARADGRGINASWRKDGDAMVEALEQSVVGVDPAAVPELDPAAIDLSDLVAHHGRIWRAPGVGHVMIMKNQPLLKLPSRLLGLV